VDSTGLKVFGEGECSAFRPGFGPLLDPKKHGWAKHRTWQKLHLAIDADTQEIACLAGVPAGVADVLTDNSVHDSNLLFGRITDRVSPMLKQVRNKVRRFYGDGAYAPWKVRNELEQHGIEQVIPPRKDANIKRHDNSKLPRLERDEAIREPVLRPNNTFANTVAKAGNSASATTAVRLPRPPCSECSVSV
jgi:hypothetical protein